MTAPRDTCSSFDAYKEWLVQEHRSFQVPADALEFRPEIRPTTNPAAPPWQTRWFLTFTDGRYIRCVENFDRRQGDGRSVGRLHGFSYHYGVDRGERDVRGRPKISKHPADTVVRIDLDDWNQYHMHCGKRPDLQHIRQEQISGSLVLHEMTMFRFVAGVLEHRKTGKPIEAIFDFEVL